MQIAVFMFKFVSAVRSYLCVRSYQCVCTYTDRLQVWAGQGRAGQGRAGHLASNSKLLVRIIATLKALYIHSIASWLPAWRWVGAWIGHYLDDRQSPSLLSILVPASQENCCPDVPTSFKTSIK